MSLFAFGAGTDITLQARLEKRARQKAGSHFCINAPSPLEQPGASISDLIALALKFIAAQSRTEKQTCFDPSGEIL